MKIPGKYNHMWLKISLIIIIVPLIVFCSGSSDNNDPTGENPTTDLIFNNVSNTHLLSNRLGVNSMDGQAYDIDNDGDMDMIIAIEFGRNVILINDGAGRLNDETDERFPDISRDSEDIAIADFDNDGDSDIIFVSEDDRVNEYYRNNGQGFFTDVSNLLAVQGTSNAVETADLNKDGFPDLIIGNQGQNFLLINDKNGSFLDETALRLPENTATTQDIELKDIDNDNDLDILEANETFNRVLINNGDGFFVDETNDRLPSVNDQTREVDLADIDNDGDLDVFFANVDFGGIGNPQNRLLLNDGTGHFSEITETALSASSFRTVDADFFDINNDGFVDILSGNRFNGIENIVLINDGNNKFNDNTDQYFTGLNSYPFDFQVSDFNNDGMDDIYFCNFRGADILFLRR